MKPCLIIIGLLALCSLTDASTCVVRQRVTYQQHYAAPAYVAPAYVAPAAVYAPVAVVPIYSHGYGATNEELAGKIERLEFELEKQKFQQERREFQQLQQLQQKFKPEALPAPAKQVMPPASKADAKEHPAIAILNKNCLSCHNATKKEGKLDLTVALSDRQLRKVATMTYTAQMPPGGKGLADDAVGQIQDWVDGHK